MDSSRYTAKVAADSQKVVIFQLVVGQRFRYAVLVACVEEMRNTYIVLLGKPEGKRPLQRSVHIQMCVCACMFVFYRNRV
jgi:hypothetical protein